MNQFKGIGCPIHRMIYRRMEVNFLMGNITYQRFMQEKENRLTMRI